MACPFSKAGLKGGFLEYLPQWQLPVCYVSQEASFLSTWGLKHVTLEKLWLWAGPCLSWPPSQRECQAVALAFWLLNKPKSNLPIWEGSWGGQGLGVTISRGEERSFKKALFLRSWPPDPRCLSISPSIQHPSFLCKWASLHPSSCQV